MRLDEPIGRDEILRYVNAKCPAPCASCGGSEFNIVNEERLTPEGKKGRAALTIFEFPDYDIQKTSLIDAVVIVCSSCGTFRLLHRVMVADWLTENPQR